jgi:ADP-heptose:LPS heptosyltransferase
MHLPARATDESWHSTLRTHLVDHAFHTLCDVTPTIKDKSYLQLPDNYNIHKLNVPPKYIVITTGSTVPVREWPAAQVNSVINWIRQQGLRIVFLGKQHVSKDIIGHFDAKINYHLGINLIDKTTLLEAHAIMSNAVAVIGLDNGLLHLAACSSVPIVAGYTTVSPKYRLPYRNNKLGWNCFAVEPDKDLDCRFCQSSCIINYEQDFRRCFHADYLCTKQLESKKWIRALKKALYGSSVATVSWY